MYRKASLVGFPVYHNYYPEDILEVFLGVYVEYTTVRSSLEKDLSSAITLIFVTVKTLTWVIILKVF